MNKDKNKHNLSSNILPDNVGDKLIQLYLRITYTCMTIIYKDKFC